MNRAHKPIPEITAECEARLWSHIEKRPDGIWAWIKPRPTGRNANVRLTGFGLFLVNRVMWCLEKRKTIPGYQIPDGLCVLHKHDVSPELYDCNPANLWLGTQKDNALDRESKGRGNQPSGDRNASRLHPERLSRGDAHWSRRHPERLARGKRSGMNTCPESRPRGLRNGNAKISDGDVIKIRDLKLKGETVRELAARYNCSEGHIYGIVRGVYRPRPIVLEKAKR